MGSGEGRGEVAREVEVTASLIIGASLQLVRTVHAGTTVSVYRTIG